MKMHKRSVVSSLVAALCVCASVAAGEVREPTLWADVTRLRVAGFDFSGEGFDFNVWPWTQKDLEKARHVEELEEDPGWLTVNIDCAT